MMNPSLSPGDIFTKNRMSTKLSNMLIHKTFVKQSSSGHPFILYNLLVIFW